MVRGRATLVVPQMAGRVPPPCGIIDARRVIHLSPTRVFAVVTTMPPPRDHRFLEPMTDRAELDLSYMSVALAVARAAGAGGEVPVGAVVVRDGLVVASAANAMVTSRDATAHAEVRAIRAAQSAIGDARLSGCNMPQLKGAVQHLSPVSRHLPSLCLETKMYIFVSGFGTNSGRT